MLHYAEFHFTSETVLIENTTGMTLANKILRIKTNGRAIDVSDGSYYWSKAKHCVISVGRGELARAKILSLDKYRKISLREKTTVNGRTYARSIKVDIDAIVDAAKAQGY